MKYILVTKKKTLGIFITTPHVRMRILYIGTSLYV